VRPHPALTNDELRAAGRICRLVEGMPLAIELAAAALRVQSCIAIADSLQESLATLSADLRAVPERHHSIRATFEHSWRLLSERERHVFARLPVFRGGFDLEAATHVAQADALLLAALVDKSLLRWDGMGRYDMHELLRQYAGEKLREAEAVGQTQDRHLRFFLALAEDAAPRLHGAERVHWLERLDCEHDNLRAALEWAFDQHAAELGARLSGALWGFWDGCGYLTEGRSWLARALSECQNISVVSRERLLHGALCLAAYQGDTESALQLGAEALELCRLLDDLREHAQVQLDLGLARLNLIDHTLAKSELTESLTLCRSVSDARGVGRALNGLGLIAGFQGYLEQAEALHSEALAFAREVGDPNEIAQVLGAIARIAFERGNAVQAVVLVEESLAYFRELHDAVGRSYAIELLGLLKFVEGNLDHAEALLKESQKLAWSVGDRGKVADSLYWLGRLARVQGNYAWASQLYEESKAFHPETPNPLVLHQLGWLALMQGDWDRALSRFAESLSIYQNLGKVNFLACSLTGFATVAVAQGKLQQATVLLGAAHQLLVVMGVHLHPIDQQDVDRTLVSVQAQLSAEAFAAAWASGQAMTLEEAVAEAMTLTAETAAEEPSAGTE
jgi:tetratricopeptide (TPR) repeat protein